jgi:hypothetical protein
LSARAAQYRRNRRSAQLTGLWPLGIHVAPYLSPSGRLVFVALSREGYLEIAAEATQLTGARRGQGGKIPAHRKYGSPGAWILEPSENHDDLPPFIALRLRKRERAALLWDRGVHLAPWFTSADCGDAHCWGRPMVAVDARHRLVAEMLLPDGEDPEPVRSALLAVLEANEGSTPVYRDSIESEDSEDDDDDDSEGEAWKQ